MNRKALHEARPTHSEMHTLLKFQRFCAFVSWRTLSARPVRYVVSAGAGFCQGQLTRTLFDELLASEPQRGPIFVDRNLAHGIPARAAYDIPTVVAVEIAFQPL
jgi:hypothetical protein